MYKSLMVFFVLLSLTACPGDNTGGNPEPKPTPTGTVSKSIDATGGNLEAVSTDGVTFKLEFPAGATRTALVLKVVPRVTEAGQFAAFEVTPKGVHLGKPVTLKLKLPTGVSTSAKTSFFFRSGAKTVPLETKFDAATKTFTTSSKILGLEDLASTKLNQTRDSLFDGVELSEISCQIERDFLQDQILNAQAWITGFAANTKQLEDRLKSIRAGCGNDADTQAVITQIQARACSEATSALTSAQVQLVETAEDLARVVNPVLNTQAMVQAAGSTCPTAADSETTTDDKFKQFADSYATKVNSPNFKADHDALWRELKSSVALSADCLLLSVSETTCQKITTNIKTLFDHQRKATYKLCRTDGSQFFIANLASMGGLIREVIPVNLPGVGSARQTRNFPILKNELLDLTNFSAADLENDAQYCASKMVLTVIGPKKTLVDLGRTLEGGATPGLFKAADATKSPVVGELQLSGSLKTFDCNNRLATDQLIIKLNNVEIKRVSHQNGDFFKTPVKISLMDSSGILTGSDLQKAGIDPDQKGTYPLQVFRSGEACGIYSDADFKLFEIGIEFDPKPKLKRVTATPTNLIASDNFTAQTFNLEYEEFGQNLKQVEDQFALLPDGTTGTDTQGPSVYQITAASGTGTRTINVRVRCSEKPKGIKRDTFKLTDQFDQDSDSVFVNTSVSYAQCPTP
jgi:hypothetical protein